MARTTPKTSQKTSQKTTQKTSARATTREASSKSFFGLPLKTWVETARPARGAEARTGKRGLAFAFGSRDAKLIKRTIGSSISKWQMQMLLESESESSFFQGVAGPVWVCRAPKNEPSSRFAELEKSSYARVRDWAGGIVPQMAPFAIDKLVLEFHGLSTEDERAVLIGLEMASYSFAENREEGGKARKKLPLLLLRETSDELGENEIQTASRLALAVNIARHLTNLPGGDLNPRSYSEGVRDLFRGSSTVEVEVWEGEKLKKEKMNLLLAVGAAAADGPRMVHLRYRPAVNSARPLAIVGKGVTFDSGGLDIKPASGMRTMKKDMGGSAAAVALLKWAEMARLPMALDVYLSLAENAIGAGAFRPGDIVIARNGMSVEIHNTDAEGRLVMADALDVAVTQKGADEPQAIIDLATLTGAIKVGLGAEIAGLFSNSDGLATAITDAGLRKGDLAWRMPLFQPYRSQLKSTFADMSNCSDSGFGGAVTAALFLESFVKEKPWAHLDIYAWRDSSGGAWAESGGNGQPVQMMAEVLERMAHDMPSEELA